MLVEHVGMFSSSSVQAARPLHVVFGATGGIGRAVTEELVRRRSRVRAVSRDGAELHGAERISVDASRPDAAAAAAEGAAVVYHCVNPGYTQWPELLPPVSRSILHAAEAAGAKLVYADNLYAYGPVGGALREDLPAAATGRKGRARVEVAAEMLAAQRDGRVRVAIGRASDYYGPHGANSNAGEPVFGRAVAGKRPVWNGRLDQPHTLHFLPDLARGLVTLAERPEADGEIWHLPAAPPLTAQQFFDLIFDAAGRPTPARAQPLAPPMLAIAGLFSPLMRELRETTYQFRAPFVVDSSKFERAFGVLESTAHREAIERTVQWFRSRGWSAAQVREVASGSSS
jgi:nucleoside-diphosphate-sugar epimerase